MGGAYSTYGGEVEKVLVGNVEAKEREHLGDLGLDEKNDSLKNQFGGGVLGRVLD